MHMLRSTICECGLVSVTTQATQVGPLHPDFQVHVCQEASGHRPSAS